MLRKTIPTVCSDDIFDAPFDFAELCGGHPMLTRVACIRWLFWPRKRLLAGCDSIFFAALLPSRCLCLCWLTGSMAGWLAVLGQTLCFGWRIFRFLVARARCKLIFVAVCLPCRRLVTAGTQARGRFSPFLCLFFFAPLFHMPPLHLQHLLLLLPLLLIDGVNDSPKRLLYRRPKVKCVRCSRPLEGLLRRR